MLFCISFFRHNKRRRVFLSDKLHPQTISVVETRADSLGIEVIVKNLSQADFSNRDFAGVLFQYPDTDGNIEDFSELVEQAHSHGVSTNQYPFNLFFSMKVIKRGKFFSLRL